MNMMKMVLGTGSARRCFWMMSLAVTVATGGSTRASQTIVVPGTDAIFLAGRTDVTIAPPGTPPAGYLFIRNSPPGPSSESFPAQVSAASGQTFQFSATGTVTFSSADTRGPDGETSFASINPIAGISGYDGPKSSLNGVFLSDADPENSAPPAALPSSDASVATLSPALGQVFFIGDGLTGTGSGTVQTFTAPAGATRLFLGYADGNYFSGPAGEYDDNSGAFTVTINAGSVPEPVGFGAIGIGAMTLVRRRYRQA